MPKKSLAEFELLVMLALARLGAGASGASIRKEIADNTGRDVAVGALYTTLSRLGDRGLVSFSISNPRPTRGGRSRKCFDLTPAGENAVRQSAAMLVRMMQGIDLAPESTSRT